jgi:hypothetical protein
MNEYYWSFVWFPGNVVSKTEFINYPWSMDWSGLFGEWIDLFWALFYSSYHFCSWECDKYVFSTALSWSSPWISEQLLPWRFLRCYHSTLFKLFLIGHWTMNCLLSRFKDAERISKVLLFLIRGVKLLLNSFFNFFLAFQYFSAG